MSRRTLSRVLGLLLLTGLFTGVLVAGTSAATAPAACPTVSCLTQTGYYQCKQAGCGCDPRTDACVAARVRLLPVTWGAADFRADLRRAVA